MTGGPRFLDEAGERETMAARIVAVDAAPEAPVSAPHRGPVFLEADPDAPQRLSMNWEPGIILAPRPVRSTALWISGGICVLFATWIGLSLAIFVLGLFQWSHALGALGTVAIVAGLALIGYGAGLEWRAYRSLQVTEGMRGLLAGNDPAIETARAASMAWARKVAANAAIEIGPIEAGLRAAGTMAEIRAILRSKLLDTMRAAALRIGQQAVIEGSAVVAICPHPALDGLVVIVRSLVMMRRIATLYAVRPGMAVTIVLMRRVAMSSAATTAVSVVALDTVNHVLSNLPILKHIVAAVPGAGTAAFRIYRLAGITAEACCPIRTDA